jgi:hypothetical protein
MERIFFFRKKFAVTGVWQIGKARSLIVYLKKQVFKISKSIIMKFSTSYIIIYLPLFCEKTPALRTIVCHHDDDHSDDKYDNLLSEWSFFTQKSRSVIFIAFSGQM